MARGYAVLANGGFLVEPYFVQRIEEDGQGVIFEATPRRACPDCDDLPVIEDVDQLETQLPADGPAPRVLSPENRYLMYSMMQDVITAGTATKARALGRQDLAGKTGTTNEQRDAWFNGYNQHLVAVTWVGFDSNAKLGRGEVGGKAALPAWIDFMRVALQEAPEDPPQMPADLVTVRIDPRTGERAAAGNDDAIFEIFRPDEVPEETASAVTNAPVGGRRGGEASAPPPVDQLF
jgi:penicillin-binding protein 1A